ncbi:DUF2142 domain-containing protein [Lachnospiraceae bacterium 62-35]
MEKDKDGKHSEQKWNIKKQAVQRDRGKTGRGDMAERGRAALAAAGTLIVLLLALWHYQEVKAGALESGDSFLYLWYGMLTICAVLTVGLAGYFYVVKRRIGIETFFLASGLSVGLMFLFVLQPLSAPDEIRHFISAYRISNQMLHVQATDEYGQVYIRKQDEFIVRHKPQAEQKTQTAEAGEQEETEVLGQLLTEHTYRSIWEKGLQGTGEDEMIPSGQIAVQTTPAAYIVPAIGISIARMLHMGGMALLYIGRFFNLAFFLGAVWMALRRLPFGKPVMCAIALLPMTLHLAASFSYDTMINALIFWFTAICLDLAYSSREVKARDIVLLAVLIGIVGPCKMVYAPVMGLCLLIPVKKFGGWKKWGLSAAVVLIVWLAAMILVNTQTISIYATGTENHIGWADETGYTLGGLLHRPGLVLQLFYNSLIWQAEYYHLTMIGAYMGQVDEVLDIPYGIVMLLTGILLLLALQRPGEETIYFRRGQRIWVWFLFAASAGLAMFSMLLGWTPVSARVICGVQGRYYLPLLPILFMTLKNRWLICTRNRDREMLYVLLCANVYGILRLFSIVSMRI